MKSANFAGAMGKKKGKGNLPPQMGGKIPKPPVMKKAKGRGRK